VGGAEVAWTLSAAAEACLASHLVEEAAMLEIVTTIGATVLAMIAVTVALPALFSLGRVGPRERAYILRQAAYWSVFALALGGWVVLGLYAMLSLPEFWRGAYWGSTAVLWLGYLPALLFTIRASNRHQARLRLQGAV
jgi:hypothetical protein